MGFSRHPQCSFPLDRRQLVMHQGCVQRCDTAFALRRRVTSAYLGAMALTRLAPEAPAKTVALPRSIRYLWVFVQVTPEESILPYVSDGEPSP